MRDYKLDKKKNKAKIKILYLRSLYSYIVTRIPIARENTMPSLVKKKPYFWLILVSFCLCYLIFEFFFNAYTMLTVDEFWFAHSVFRFAHLLPYRDFFPYKTVLGYYFLLFPLLLGNGIFSTLILIKNT